MPITQDRMIKLITAAQDFDRALTLAESIVQSAYSRVAKGETSAEDELAQLGAQIVASFLLRHPIDSASTLAVEASHFKKAAKRNRRAQRQQAAKRHQEEPQP